MVYATQWLEKAIQHAARDAEALAQQIGSERRGQVLLDVTLDALQRHALHLSASLGQGVAAGPQAGCQHLGGGLHHGWSLGERDVWQAAVHGLQVVAEQSAQGRALAQYGPVQVRIAPTKRFGSDLARHDDRQHMRRLGIGALRASQVEHGDVACVHSHVHAVIVLAHNTAAAIPLLQLVVNAIARYAR